jgi:hypothetical protein
MARVIIGTMLVDQRLNNIISLYRIFAQFDILYAIGSIGFASDRVPIFVLLGIAVDKSDIKRV